MILKDLSRKIYKRICYSLEGKRVLYVGISPKGRDKELIKYLEFNNDLTTLDRDLLVARLYSKKHYILDIKEPLPFPDNYFDAIIMLGVIGYGLDDIENILKTFENIKKHLKEHGKVYFEINKEKKT